MTLGNLCAKDAEFGAGAVPAPNHGEPRKILQNRRLPVIHRLQGAPGSGADRSPVAVGREVPDAPIWRVDPSAAALVPEAPSWCAD